MSRSGASTAFSASTSTFNLRTEHKRRLQSALTRVRINSGFCTIAGVGHSMVAGTQGIPGVTDWLSSFADMLANSGYSRAGEGIIPGYSSATDTRRNFGAGWVTLNPNTTLIQNTTTINPATFTSNKNGTVVDVWYWNQSNAFTVAIDGGVPATVTPTGTASYQVATYSGLADTAHSVDIVRVTGNTYIFGVDVRSVVGGVKILNVGIGGAKASIFNEAAFYSSMKFAAPNADALFIEIMHNDLVAATPVDTWTTQVQTGISRAKLYGASVFLLTDTPVGTVDQTSYINALYSLAVSNDLPLIDLGKRMGTFATANTNGLISVDTVHPSPRGYADQARAIFNALAL